MRNNILITAVITVMTLSSCAGDIKHGTTDIDSWPYDKKEFKYEHPCMLHSQKDFDYIKKKLSEQKQPWKDAFDLTLSRDENQYSKATYKASPTTQIVRGDVKGTDFTSENYANAMKDAAAAYQLGLMWRLTGDEKYAKAGVAILNAWAKTCREIKSNDSNQYLAAGFYGYEFANAAELMRDYSGWDSADFEKYKKWMVDVFYSKNKYFLDTHLGQCVTHYWANWDLANMNSMLAIGILTDDDKIVGRAIEYFKSGGGNGCIERTVVALHNDPDIAGKKIGQCQESGRDQGHTTLVVSIVGAFCQMAYNVGEDLFAYKDNRVLALCEYIAKYNGDMSSTVPYTSYKNCNPSVAEQTSISSVGRGTKRPGWELIYNHYTNIKKLDATYSEAFAATLRPEHGGGYYDPNSGGYDQLGFGTLMHTYDADYMVVEQ